MYGVNMYVMCMYMYVYVHARLHPTSYFFLPIEKKSTTGDSDS